eukprot:CAMPEP_0178985412 /NCGR_PEP_ID=MMETSP0795-20121207/2138_1 /TAXON_ID=88552 /ORGANISM="Amoebophrya sp., Strain Ameob2" /LENGTH=372 /DNA_ID=CAMNT_0020676367 /DNA_START=136 /DNA_END=1254 /DNA_ORIENTATION=-
MVDERYVFKTEWFDGGASLIRGYQLTFYPKDATIELYDMKAKRLFLKRSPCPAVTADKLYLGSTLCIHSRQMKLVDYCDVFTRNVFEEQKTRTFALIKPDAYAHIGRIVQIIHDNKLVISKFQMLKMTRPFAEEQYAEHKGKPFYDNLVNFMTSDVCVAMELIGTNAVSTWRSLMGPTNTQTAREEAPASIRARFGTDGTRNATHGSDSSDSAARELNLFFGPKAGLPTTAIFNNCTLGIVKPHAISAGHMGPIVDRILEEGFEISAMKTWTLEKNLAEEFLEVYRGILPEYHDLVEELAAGPALVMEIRQENAVDTFRNLVGPIDPEVASHLRPDTLRAKYGVNRVENAVHCTDLPEDGLLEVYGWTKWLP